MKLTEKQKRFADYYVETGNATEAYKRAYNCENDITARTNANKNLQKPTIRKYIDSLLSVKDKERIASQDEVLSFLTKVLRGEETENIPMFAKDHFEMVENTPSIKDRTKAAELLGKRYTLWTDKQQIEGNIGVTIVDDIDD